MLGLEGRPFTPPPSFLTTHRLGLFTSRDNNVSK